MQKDFFLPDMSLLVPFYVFCGVINQWSDSSELHSEQNRVSAEKNNKRILKTPGQVVALENFYNEHKYPSEEMKTVLAEQIGLTEKQISSWFCHRRLKDKRGKDEVCTNGRHDRSSGINQDRGSGLLQDSCGSTKQGDYRNTDAREVESERLYGHDFPTADRTSRYTGNLSDMDNSSSESGSSLQDKFISQNCDAYNGESSKYLTETGSGTPLIPKGTNSMGYKPSGYLKVKGEIENAAITAVKRQLGRHYREDGPLLGVEFDELPPGAFASPSREPVNGPIYVGDLSRIRCPEASGSRKHSSLSTAYEVFNAKMGSQDSYIEEANCNPDPGFDSQDRKSRLQQKRRPRNNYLSPNAGENNAKDRYDDFDGETSIYNQRKTHMVNSKHHVDGMRSNSVSNHHGPSIRRVSSEQKEALLHDFDNESTKIVQENDYFSRPSHLKFVSSKPLNTKEKAPGVRMKKEERQYLEKKGAKMCHDRVKMKKHSVSEMTVAKRYRAEFPQQEIAAEDSFPEMPWKTNLVGRKHRNLQSSRERTKVEIQNMLADIGRSFPERPSSFSEDETAETSLSAD
ncbi:hypothetical protein Tsubulata_013892 [Turnera subulata]|uniref:Homeobox domain-containing protein n=1 Tax=Turnera subulata TaxID=218843 RepID=A0A9Q0F8U6_9ROSI|nr:hypothetical protein Tsubulata_013892 [Turnera subulata]